MKQEKISIDEDTHRLLKEYCVAQGYKMGAFVSRLIREKIGDEREDLLTVRNEICTKESA